MRGSVQRSHMTTNTQKSVFPTKMARERSSSATAVPPVAASSVAADTLATTMCLGGWQLPGVWAAAPDGATGGTAVGRELLFLALLVWEPVLRALVVRWVVVR